MANKNARTLHVRPVGSDDSSGDEEHPFASIQRAANVAQPGDTVIVGDGEYFEEVQLPSGEPDNPITFKNAPGERPVLNGGGYRYMGLSFSHNGYLIIEGFELHDYAMAGIGNRGGGGDVTVRGCRSYHNGSAGICLNYARDTTENGRGIPTNMIVEDNVCFENGWHQTNAWASGIHLNNKNQGDGVRHIIRRNMCYNNYDRSNHTDGNGIMFDIGGLGSYCLIESNLCFNNAAGGINVLNGEAAIVNNTCYRNAWDAALVDWKGTVRWAGEIHVGANSEKYQSTAGATVVRNNIVWTRRKHFPNGLEVYGCSPTFENNLLWSDEGAHGFDIPASYRNTIVADPLFVRTRRDNSRGKELYTDWVLSMDADAYDFRLKSDSPAIRSGSDGAAIDITGSRGSSDGSCTLGAYQHPLE